MKMKKSVNNFHLISKCTPIFIELEVLWFFLIKKKQVAAL